MSKADSGSFLPVFSASSRRYLLVLVLLLAAFFRFWQLDSLPPGLYHDEAYNGLDALSLTQGKQFPQFYEGWELYANDAHADRDPVPTRFPLFFEGNYGREPLHVYLMALSIKLFGATPFAIRFVPAAAGVLAVLTTYLAAGAILRPGFNSSRDQTDLTIAKAAPLLAAAVMAILYPAVHFSRFGIRAMVFVPIETMAVYFFWKAIEAIDDRHDSKRGYLFFTAAGLLLGLGLYTYAAARLFPLLFAAFGLFWFWRDRTVLRRFWRGFGLMAAVSLAAAAPLLLFFSRYPYFFIFRIAFVANKGKGAVAGKPWLTWFNNVGRVVRGLYWQGEMHLRHNLPGRSFLDPIQALFFSIGALRTARRWLQPRQMFMLLWLVVMLLPTIMSGDAPHFGRMSGAAPVIALLSGTGAAWLFVTGHHWLQRRFSTARSTQASLAIIAMLLVISTFTTGRDYFQRYAQHPDVPADFYLADWQLGKYAASQSAETSLFLSPTQEEMATIYFALADPERLHSFAGSAGLIPAGTPGHPALYLLRPESESALAALAAYFPDGTLGERQASFLPFHVPASAVRAAAGTTSQAVWDGKIALHSWSQSQAGSQLAVMLTWQAVAVMDKEFTAFVHVLDSTGSLVAQLDQRPAGYPTSDWRPGEMVVAEFVLSLPADLPPGTYDLETGWYYLPTLAGLGEPAALGSVVWQDD